MISIYAALSLHCGSSVATPDLAQDDIDWANNHFRIAFDLHDRPSVINVQLFLPTEYLNTTPNKLMKPYGSKQ